MRTLSELMHLIPIVDLRTKAFWEAVDLANKKFNYSERVTRAVNILVERKVELLEDGKTARVKSTTDTRFPHYIVTPEGRCNCEDYHKNGAQRWSCKHGQATSIIRKARKIYELTVICQKAKQVELLEEEMYSCVG